jgi:Dictyostelium (slime mold) repeat
MTRAAVQAAVLSVLAGCGQDLEPPVSEGQQEGVIWDCSVDADCNDGNACTQDHCNVGLGICQNYAIAGCCTSAASCDDGNACTADACTNNVCTHTPSCGPPPPQASFTQDNDKVTFTNSDASWVIYKRCIGPSQRGGANLTVGPGYVAKVTVPNGSGGNTVVVNDEDVLCKSGGVPCTGAKAGPNWGWGGLGSFGWHHARGPGPLGPNNAWDASGRFCQADTGVGVTSATITKGPVIDSGGVGELEMDVYFGDIWTSQLMRVRYKYRIYSSVVKMWALVTEHCPNGNCGVNPPGPAYIKEPKFVAESIIGGGFTNITTFNDAGTSVGTYSAGATNPDSIGNGQSSNSGRSRVKFDYATTSTACNNTTHPCLNVVMRRLPTPSTDDISPGGATSDWQNPAGATSPTGLDGWAVASQTRAAIDPADTSTACSGGSAGNDTSSTALRRWEYGGWKNTNSPTAPYTRVGVAFHGWEGGPGAYNCGALSRLFGPDNERWAVHGEFSIGSGWALQ